MARILIVGCGCRGRELAAALAADGHAVRGTTRDPDRLPEIEAAGVEGAVADPDRLGTLLGHLEGVSVLCWLMGSATGEPDAVAALHDDRLEALLEKLVETHVRGFVYEAVGSVSPELLGGGAEVVRRAGETWQIPTAVIEEVGTSWLEDGRAAVGRVLR